MVYRNKEQIAAGKQSLWRKKGSTVIEPVYVWIPSINVSWPQWLITYYRIDIENVESEPIQLTKAAAVCALLLYVSTQTLLTYLSCSRIDIDNVESTLTTCAQLDQLCNQLANNFLRDRQAVLDALTEWLETLVHVEEYLWSAISVHRDHIEGFMCRCKLVVAATEELWYYAAVNGGRRGLSVKV
jgi:hypothetical protein